MRVAASRGRRETMVVRRQSGRRLIRSGSSAAAAAGSEYTDASVILGKLKLDGILDGLCLCAD